MKIWKEAADSYRYVDNYKMQIDCLEKSLAIIIPVLNQYEFSKFDGDYWFLMGDLIRAYIQVGDFEKAKCNIANLKEQQMDFIKVLKILIIHGNVFGTWGLLQSFMVNALWQKRPLILI